MRKGECAENRYNIRVTAVRSKRIKEGPVTMNDDDDDVFGTAADRHGGLSIPPSGQERMGCGADPLPARETSADGERA